MSDFVGPAQKIEALIDHVLGMYAGGIGDNPICRKDVDDSAHAEEIIKAALRIFLSQNYSDIFED
jgi:hypothetical protein